jgi:hypothetical protein
MRCCHAVNITCSYGMQLDMHTVLSGSWACIQCLQAVGHACNAVRQSGMHVVLSVRQAGDAVKQSNMQPNMQSECVLVSVGNNNVAFLMA